ncbi:adenylate/guanylate cyclase domain-containing protein [Pararhodospirillum photometricum]|uniref:Adenylate/guanylate cyclase n=1 Tax=Pararhodospirillum photometricum DSM 122 TaxID=1150469 RepID=H6SRM9_PARPM|nr:adenylate/guanylate cyclase domain-containing protein [Pararhodospirillum photometricum]CCG07558.1 Adenylate/guanylate cyclase [Pararhodospirillum photometricum DSM 122]
MDEAPALDAAEAERTRKRKEKEEREEAERRAKAKKEEEEQRRKEKESADKAAQKKLAEEGPPLTADQEQARRIAMAFLAGAVASLKGSRIQIDTFTRFGINLYLTGAVGLSGERLGLSSPQVRPVLSEALELMGNRPALVSLFVDKIDEYLLEPRYLQMARHGRDAMAHMLGQNGDPFAELPGIMAEWTTPQTRPSSSSTVAIVFTDMVGSTDHNSRLGDAASRGLNRIHNTLVRSALARFDGREVKNTGDGIMAIFPVVSQAVEAMVEVQRSVANHNAQTPGNPLHIRVGINAGEPVVEEGDYFGLAVTLAARICNQAGPDQILCSGVVRDLSQGKSLYFRNRGDVTLKGIVDPQRIYEIAWADAAAAERP